MLLRVVASPRLVAHLAPQRQGLLVVRQRLRLVAQGGVHPADVVEGGGLAALVAHLALKRQGLLVVLASACALSPRASYTLPMLLRVVASPALSPTWRCSGQGLLVVLERLRLVAQGGVHQADVVEGGGLAGLVAHLALSGRACS